MQLTNTMEQLEREIAKRKQSEERLAHLNAVLRAIRNVNQLITREKDRDRLLQRACEILIETRGYFNAWIALLDDSSQVHKTFEAGLGDHFQPIRERLQQGQWINCVRQALAQEGAVAILDPPSACADCPLASRCQGRGAITNRLAYGDKTYGWLCVSIPADLAKDREELFLFEEVAGDLAFALHSIELREERQRAEAARLQSELNYQRLVQNIPAVVFKGYADYTLDFFDPRIEAMTGHLKEEFNSRRLKWSDLIVEEDLPEAKAIFIQALKSDKAYVREYRIRHKTGGILWIQERSQIICTPEGRIDYVSGVFFDITERKQHEEAVRESERFLQSVFDAIQDGITVRDRNWNLVKVNRWIEEKFRAQMPLVGKKCYAVFHQRQSPCPWCPALPAMQTGCVHSELVPVPSLDDCQSWFEVTAFPLTDAQGQVIGVIEHAKDITARKLAEEALRASEVQMRTVIESAPVGISIVQHDKYVYVNPAWLRMFGYERPEEVLGCTVGSFTVTEQRDLARQRRLDKLAGKEAPHRYEPKVLKKTGQPFDVSVRLALIDYQGEPATLGFIIDISEEKILRARLRQAQKMEAVGNLAGGIAHDINNILQVIQGHVELMLLDDAAKHKNYEALQDIDRTVDRGAKLVRSLLTFSRQVESQPRMVNLNQEVERAGRLLTRIIPRMIDIRLRLGADLWPIKADPTQLEQVLLNLVCNARDAMPEGGKLTIATQNVVLDEQYCQAHPGARPGDYALLAVTDTGCGMAPETVERIFEPFFTTKGPGMGTGLGLSTVYGIVKSHNGYIWCDSQPEKGTTFSIYLPALPEADQLLENRAEREAKISPPSRGRTILLVDDEASVLNLGQRMLEHAGYQVMTAASGEEALEIFQRQPGSIDLVLLDLSMPGMGGARCLKELIRLEPRTRVLVVSGYIDSAVSRDILQAGAQGFIHKPFRLGELLQAVQKVLDKA